MINTPLPPCDKILQITLPAYLQLQSPYYFQKVVWPLSFDYFLPRSTLHVPCVTSSFIHLFFSFFRFSGFEYGNAVRANMWAAFRSAEESFLFFFLFLTHLSGHCEEIASLLRFNVQFQVLVVCPSTQQLKRPFENFKWSFPNVFMSKVSLIKTDPSQWFIWACIC